MTTGTRISDADWLLEVLVDGEWHSLSEILRRSMDERGHGLTVHSRASELRRRRGLMIEQRSDPRNKRASEYRLVSFVSGVVERPDDRLDGGAPLASHSGGSPVGSSALPAPATDSPFAFRDSSAVDESAPLWGRDAECGEDVAASSPEPLKLDLGAV